MAKRSGLMTHLKIFLGCMAVGGLITFCNYQQAARRPHALIPRDARIVRVAIDRFLMRTEVADTPELRGRGLAGREGLERGHGMLFVYDEPAVREFAEPGARMPLTVAFIDAGGVVVKLADLDVGKATAVSSDVPVPYVLELRQGWFEDRGLGVGAKIEILEEIPPLPVATPAD